MQTDKKIYIGLAILLVIAGLIFWQSQKSKDELAARSNPINAELTAPQFKLDADLVDKVTKISIKEKDKQEIVLEKRGENWTLTQPIEATASQSNVKSVLDNLKSLETKDAINDTPEASAMYKNYDLEPDHAIHVTAYAGDNASDKVFDAFFGKSGTRGQLARLDDRVGIWVVKGFASYQYTREVKDWRDKTILKFEEQNVVSVTIENADGSLSFSKNNDDWSGTRNKKKIDRLDPEKIKDMLRAFRSLNAEDFGDKDKDVADTTGLGPKPVATITIVLKDEAGTHKLDFGNTSSGSSRYMKREGDNVLYIIGSWASDWAVAKIDKFQKPDGKEAAKEATPPTYMPSFDYNEPMD